MTPTTWLDAIGFTWLAPLDGASLQGLWIRLGWGLVIGAWIGHLLQRWLAPRLHGAGAPMRPHWAWAVAGTATLATWLAPGPWSAAYWLGLAFFAPSGLLVGLSAASCWHSIQQTAGPTLPTPLAVVLALAGTVLYAAHLTALPWSLYPLGQPGTVWLLLSASAVSLGLWWLGHGVAAWVVAMALWLHSALGLPTTQAWDALLDPWLWLWALAACLGRGVRRLATMRAHP